VVAPYHATLELATMPRRLSIGTTTFQNPSRRLLALAGLALLCGCATGTGILPAGPDT
jgi:hypothetical protein